MENKDTFKMTYSASQQEEIQSIRKKYLPEEQDKMAQLRALDARVNSRAVRASVSVGVVGTLLLGLGMSFAMSDLGALIGQLALPIGIAVGAVGIAVLACAYPLYSRTLKKERQKAAPEIMRLTDELMK